MTEGNDIMLMHDHIQDTISQCHPILVDHSGALFAVDAAGVPDLYSSCVFLNLDDSNYLITAAHAPYQIEKSGSTVHVGVKNIQEVIAKEKRTSSDGSDPLDLAVYELAAGFVEESGIKPVREEDTLIGRSFKNPHMQCMHGFPLTKNKQFNAVDMSRNVFSTYAFTYAGAQPKRAVYGLPERNASTHSVLSYNLSRRPDGQKVNPPKPKGMSGGGLWVVPNSFDASKVYLGGILIEHIGKNVVATRIERVADIIRANF